MLAERNSQTVNKDIALAEQHGWLAICIINDYTTIQRRCHLTNENTAQVNSLCIIVCRIFPKISAIPLTCLQQLQSPIGIDPILLEEELSSPGMMHFLASSYSDNMVDWFTQQFFHPKAERYRVYTNMYRESENARKA